MYNNTYLIRFGINPDDYKKTDATPIPFNDGFIIELEQKSDKEPCPYCGSVSVQVKGYYFIEVNSSSTLTIKDTLRIKRIRFKCNDCNKTFSPKLEGIDFRTRITTFNKQQLYYQFQENKTFSVIAKDFHISKMMALNYFDEFYPVVKRKTLPKILCIDEFHFSSTSESKYCCVISDYENKEIVDIIQSRQMHVLDEYFTHISQKERDIVEFFVSDMYDGYRTIKRKFFKNATHIIDKFHIVTQLTNAVNNVRTYVMKNRGNINDMHYAFMKKNWKLYLCKKNLIPNRIYHNKATKKESDYVSLVFNSIKCDESLWEGYLCLQDLYRITDYDSYEEVNDYINFIADRLLKTASESLKGAARTYKKWHEEIANAYTINEYNYNITNSIAENINNHIKTIMKNAYGYQNFDRFRRRCLVILRKKA